MNTNKSKKPRIYGIVSDKRLILVVVVIIIGLSIACWTISTTSHNKSITPNSTTSKEVEKLKDVASNVTIAEPADGTVLVDEEVTVAGTVGSGTTVTVNGVEAQVKNGRYSKVVKLEVGKNRIVVDAIKGKNEKSTVTISVFRKEPVSSAPSIYLSGKYLTSPDVQLNWSTSAIDAGKGFHVLHSLTSQPTYPVNLDKDLGADVRTYTKYNVLDGQVHYFRICQVLASGECGVYSNEVAILAQLSSSVPVLKLTGITGTKVSWDFFSTQSHGGYMILWSTETSPSYPNTGNVYSNLVANPIVNSGEISNNLVSGQTYHVRVCEYLGGKCGTYSDETTFVAP